MKKINKGTGPLCFKGWKNKCKKADQRITYNDLRNPEKCCVIQSLLKEQHGLCAYCGRKLPVDPKEYHKISIEHIIP